MMKKIFILSSLVISALLIEAQAPTQPNFVLIIADEEAPLAIAGIKGGQKAEITFGEKYFIPYSF